MNLKLLFFTFFALFFLVESKTSTVIPFLLKSTANYSNPIYACGDEFMDTVCKCSNFELKCYLSQLPHLNIEIIKENFVVKIAKFQECGLTGLRKDQILPGREGNIENLFFYWNNISYIENGTFDAFTNLKELNLVGNIFTSIREGILTKKLGFTLLKLELSHNKLRDLKATTFKHMTKLENLDLSKTAGINKYIFSPYLSNLKILRLGFCNITTLDDDFFVYLVNLKELSLYHNPITTVPKAINYVKNLEDFDLSSIHIKILNKNSFGFNDKMQFLYFGGGNLTVIDDCAFCNFPNLKTIGFWFNKNLTTFHENAFGSISTGILYSKLTEFSIIGSNISTISERLFDWSKADELYLGTKGYHCDCSMAWLINDLHLSDSIFSSKLQKSRMIGQYYRCNSPPEMTNKNFTEVSGKICGGKLSSFYHKNSSSSTSSKSSKFHWIFLIAILFGIAILSNIYQKEILKFIYYRNISQQENDETKLFHYFNSEEDSASVSVF